MNAADHRRSALVDKLRELGARFAERNVADLATLEVVVARLRDGDGSAAADIESIAHRISGTGATLGFPEISDAAECLEREAALSGGPDIARVTQALRALSTAVARGSQRV